MHNPEYTNTSHQQKMTILGIIGAFWGIFAFVLLLGSAIIRLAPIALDAF